MANPMPPGGEQPEDHHFIPKFYLKGFADQNKTLWVCEKFKPIRASKPKHEANRPDYYAHTEKGKRDTTAEDAFKTVESCVAKTIAKLANPQFTPKDSAIDELYLFVALVFARVPSWRENLDRIAAEVARRLTIEKAADKEEFYKSVAEYEKATGSPIGMDYEQLRQYAQNGEYTVNQESAAFNLGSMFTSAFHIHKELLKFGYEVLHAPTGSYFVTSDSPVITIRRMPDNGIYAGMGFGWPNTHVLFPLNKRACLRLRKGAEAAAIEITEGALRNLNKGFMASATRYLYSSQSYRSIARQFDEYGCKVKPGVNAFLTNPMPGPPPWQQTPDSRR